MTDTQKLEPMTQTEIVIHALKTARTKTVYMTHEQDVIDNALEILKNNVVVAPSPWQDISTAPSDGTISLTKGLFALVDPEDLPKLNGVSWQARERHDKKCWYAVNSRGDRMHRIIMGVESRDIIVDHINGNGLDNRKKNLRVGNQSLNSVNRKETPGEYMRGTRPKKGKWQSYIKISGKQKSLGYFNTEKEAHEAYVHAAKQQYGDWMPLPPGPGGEE